MITIKNTQRTMIIKHNRIKKIATTMLKTLRYDKLDLGIWFTTNKTIRCYNRDYRGKDKPTDILSFPYHSDLKPGERIVVHSPEDANLGDLIISLEYVQKEAYKTWNRTFDEHLTVLLAHGIAHLLGY